MEYCCHVWAGASGCYLENLLDKLQKHICRTVGPSLAASLEALAHRQNVARLSLFYRYYFGRCSSDRLHDISVMVCRCYKDVFIVGTSPSPPPLLKGG